MIKVANKPELTKPPQIKEYLCCYKDLDKKKSMPPTKPADTHSTNSTNFWRTFQNWGNLKNFNNYRGRPNNNSNSTRGNSSSTRGQSTRGGNTNNKYNNNNSNNRRPQVCIYCRKPKHDQEKCSPLSKIIILTSQLRKCPNGQKMSLLQHPLMPKRRKNSRVSRVFHLEV